MQMWPKKMTEEEEKRKVFFIFDDWKFTFLKLRRNCTKLICSMGSLEKTLFLLMAELDP